MRHVAIKPAVPSVAEVDGPWLTSVLEAAGIADGEEVRTVGARPIGFGQVGQNIRFSLTWSSPRPDLPVSVVGKFPSTSELSRATAAAGETYVKEVGFYRDLQAKISIRTPLVHYVADAPTDNNFVLLMADLAPAQQGDQIAGTDIAHARLAVEAAADLHASTWGAEHELTKLPWLPAPDPDRAQLITERFRFLFELFSARYANSLHPDDLQLGRWLGDHLASWVNAFDGERCLVHNDFRLDNMLFERDTLTVVDWQTLGIGYGPTDLAYFIGAGLLPELRRIHEPDLLAQYIDALGRRGLAINRLQATKIADNYRLGTASGYVMAVVASQIVEQTERGDAMFVAMASRHADQMRAHGLLDML